MLTKARDCGSALICAMDSSCSEQEEDDLTRPDEYEEMPIPDGKELVKFSIPRARPIEVVLPPSTLVHPRSQYIGYEPALTPVKEWVAVDALLDTLAESMNNEEDSHIEFELDDFSVYVDSKLYPNELRSLHHLSTKTGNDKLYFDGTLSVGVVKYGVRKVQFSDLPVGNYGEEHATVRDRLWIHSTWNKKRKREIYYRLRKPAKVYERFYHPFLWVADLTKHVVDYCTWMAERDRFVTLLSFQDDFSRWLSEIHGDSADLSRWRQPHPSPDFRTSLVANAAFIWKELTGTWSSKQGSINRYLLVWNEVVTFDLYKPIGPARLDLKNRAPVPTVVTQYIKDCFAHMKIGRILRVGGQPTNSTMSYLQNKPKRIEEEEEERARSFYVDRTKDEKGHEAMIKRIKPGDTIATLRDEEGTDTTWKIETAVGVADDNRWFGLVQKVHENRSGALSFDISWLYRPSDTPCSLMKYPWNEELFLSDHCTCQEGASSRVTGDQVIGVVKIHWFGGPEGNHGEFFIRQTYMVDQRRWVALVPAQMKCNHQPERPPFLEGDTILALPSLCAPAKYLEPYQIVRLFEQGDKKCARLRRLLRKREFDPGAPPNELVYSNEMHVLPVGKIDRRCFVRFFRRDEAVPDPYNRGGVGHLYYIKTFVDGQRTYFFKTFPPDFRQGFDPTRPRQKLRGLDLFCGAGNLGRGLEDAGTVEMLWANDLWDRAIHTYMANSPHADRTSPFLGSVDVMLERAMTGKFADKVPRHDEVDFISAGSPCPGFSAMTYDKTTPEQLKNQSLVASFASFVDFYRPKYGLLENVVNIVASKEKRLSEDAFAQLVCAIVGMGYQLQLVLGDAWSFGSPQSRSRVFLCFALPGMQLPEPPIPSHSHYPGAHAYTKGHMANGEPFAHRFRGVTPFKFISAGEGTADLPDIQDGKPDICVPFPDHRLSSGLTAEGLSQITAIPTRPAGMCFASAWNEGKGPMTLSERELFPKPGTSRVKPNSKGWGRVRSGSVFGTVKTTVNQTDARCGFQNHWRESRHLSLMEVRRAQGFLDHEPLLGTMTDQWRLVGNSVARPIALALGLQFREAWVGTLYDDEDSASASDDGRSRSSSRGGTPSLHGAMTPESSGPEAGRAGKAKKRQLPLQQEMHAYKWQRISRAVKIEPAQRNARVHKPTPESLSDVDLLLYEEEEETYVSSAPILSLGNL